MQQEAFGPWLARQLRRTGLSQAQLAEQLGLTRAAVSAWVNERAEPRDEMKRAIAKVFGTNAAALHDRTADVDAAPRLKWRHRPAHIDGGREYGNAAAFAFEADLSVLAREATQNSLDERWNGSEPVRTDYVLHELTGEHLQAFLDALQWDELIGHYKEAAAADQKMSRSLRAALDDLAETGSLILLRIDDYNAWGLTGPEYGDGRFAAVVRRQLDSHKRAAGRAGGSYGLGKVALWASSRFNLVLMTSTLSEPFEGRTERRTIGRIDLPWHEIDGVAYAGPAWFGAPDDEPGRGDVSRSWWADEPTIRDLHLKRSSAAPGTSFLVVGVHDTSAEAETLQGMHDKLVRSLADGFWAAMTGGRDTKPLLEARVSTWRNGHVVIAEERVDPRNHHPALARALQAYLDGETVTELTSGDHVAQVDVPLFVSPRRGETRGKGKGQEHRTVLLLTPADDEAKKINRVTLMRGNRMSITEHKPSDLPLGTTPFQAVLLAGYATAREGDDVARAELFLQASEPPEHDRWGRTEELSSLYARGALSRLNEFYAELDKAIRKLVGRREVNRDEGPAVLRELLKLDGFGLAGARRAQGAPAVHDINAQPEDDGAWHVRVRLKLPDSEAPWLLTPVAKFDVRSGPRPVVKWDMLTGSEDCSIEDGNIRVQAGVRSAAFTAVTDPSTHPVPSSFARLMVDIQRARGGDEA